MGVYYKVACDAKRESIDPGCISDSGVKLDSIAHPLHPVGPVVMFALGTNWVGQSVRLANDSADDAGYFDYTDVTEFVLIDYNAAYSKPDASGAFNPPLEFTP